MEFRYWCVAAKNFVEDYRYSGDLFEFLDPDRILIPLQSTGLNDSAGKIIYEGDILEIPIPSDNIFWEDGDLCPADIFQNFPSSSFRGEIARNPCIPCNFWISATNADGLEVVLPLSVSTSGRVIGDIFSRVDEKVRAHGKMGLVSETYRISVKPEFHKFRFWCSAFSCYAKSVWYSGEGDQALKGDDGVRAEQCSGLTDSEGTFIFENDVVKNYTGYFSVVRSGDSPCNLILEGEGEVAIGLDERGSDCRVVGRTS
jgi:hypothetical protein